MATVCFQSKATTLCQLQEYLQSAVIPDLKWFTALRWKTQSQEIIEEIQSHFGSKTVVIRSSATIEDSTSCSMAGAFCSVLHINASEDEQLRAAIDRVVTSFHEHHHEDNQFFVQEQVVSPKISGVLFTRDLDSFAPYYICNYDDHSGSTESVTSGSSNTLHTWIRYKHAPHSIKNAPLERVIQLAQELEHLFDCDHLDIEFALGHDDTLYLFQVRPLVSQKKANLFEHHHLGISLDKIYRKIKKLNAPHPGLHGKRNIYSIMTDWNPAEMIGTKPRRLALSLYKELITDAIWAYQRNNYGYLNLRSYPLLVSFLGNPYIDVRCSFNSFIPSDLDSSIAGKLVDYYIDRLTNAPTEHDKVEFTILFSCYYLNFVEKSKVLLEHGFSELELDRIKFSLLRLTNNVISPISGLYKKDLRSFSYLEERLKEITESDLPLLEKTYWLIEDCKRYGTLPFAGLARAGFIAVQFLRSFVDLGIFTEGEMNRYMNSLNTIARQLSDDTRSYSTGKLSREDFLQRYGHLRPGSYDITSLRYDEAFEKYFEHTSSPLGDEREGSFNVSRQQKKQIEEHLIANGITATADELLLFIKETIEGREYGKYVFTKSLSQILSYLGQLGQKYEITREGLSHLNIRTVLDLYSSLCHRDVKDIFEGDIAKNRADYELTKALKLPQLILSEDDVYEFSLGNVEPNFVTHEKVTTPIVCEHEFDTTDLTNKIVLIPSADPGYDWIFSRNIAGLITMFGGANSHMTIRCAELQIPAVIGCGEQNYAQWSTAKMLEIDCSNKQVKTIH